MSDKSENSKMSTVAPPVELPSFVLKQQKELKETTGSNFKAAIPSQDDSVPYDTQNHENKGESEEQDETPSLQMQDIAQALTPLTEGVKNSVFYGWMKDSLKSSMEIAKDSVQKVVVTLDPQMGSILHSGGNIEVIVASNNEDKIDPVREAFQGIFKKATIYGRGSHSIIAAQPVGFQNAELAAKERINQLRLNESYIDKVILSVENFLLEVSDTHWFDLDLLLLSDSRHNITIKLYTQMTPIPFEMVQIMQSDTPSDYDKKETGYSITVGRIMAQNLDVQHYEWHKTYTSIDRSEMIFNAAKSLASIYKRELQLKSTKKVESTN
ncbi:unnamed protein product [Chironomus riparius]|uniref:Non-canonical purine NTP phosphatase/PRRC1 domain-containing protein n=1 Tax=Chironomus riparius TaxID=315576 RepID=A0A9N9WQT9_9DIPT|nr:unnamed protein product [Chironomus riparius]